MKKYLLLFTTFFLSFLSIAQEAQKVNNLDIAFKKYTGWFVDFIFYEIPFSESFNIPWVLIVLIGGAIYFTFYFKLTSLKLIDFIISYSRLFF